MGFVFLGQQIDCNHLEHTRAKPQGTLEKIHTLPSDKWHNLFMCCSKQFWHFNALVGVTLCEHMEICVWSWVLCCEVFFRCTHTDAPLPLAIPFFVQHGYHQLKKICSWSASFGYIELCVYSQDIFYELRHIKWDILHLLTLSQKISVPQFIIYCQFTMEKYGYMIIHNSYLLIILLSVECTPYENKNSMRHTRTANRK